jgi:hypothetical protein
MVILGKWKTAEKKQSQINSDSIIIVRGQSVIEQHSNTMSIPQPNIIYRIQNVDFGTYLELWDPEEELVVLRPFKDTELQQVGVPPLIQLPSSV